MDLEVAWCFVIQGFTTTKRFRLVHAGRHGSMFFYRCIKPPSHRACKLGSLHPYTFLTGPEKGKTKLTTGNEQKQKYEIFKSILDKVSQGPILKNILCVFLQDLNI